MSRKELPQCEIDALNSVLRRAAERMERRKRRGLATAAEVEQLAHAIEDCERMATEAPIGERAQLRNEPRDE
jgi:hypothetical protein